MKIAEFHTVDLLPFGGDPLVCIEKWEVHIIRKWWFFTKVKLKSVKSDFGVNTSKAAREYLEKNKLDVKPPSFMRELIALSK